MRETILPPPPSVRIAAWARLNAIWFGVVDVFARCLGGVFRAVQRDVAELLGPAEVSLPLGSLGALAPGRAARVTAATWAPHLHRDASREERPTAVEVRRPA
jgi:hypothetical protein